MVYLFLRGLLRPRLNVQRSPELVVPFSPFESLEAVDEQRGVRLMHGEAHALVILVSVEGHVVIEGLLRLLRLFNHGSLDGLAELLERVLCLQSLAE